MDPNAIYYLVFGGAGVLAGVVVDAYSTIPWWTAAGLGLLTAWAFTWLTALDDARRPWRSLKVLIATLRDPSTTTRTRALLYEIPLYTPSSDLQGTCWLSGGGVSYGNNLLSPARPSISVTWTNADATVSTRTATRPPATTAARGLPPGISHQLLPIEDDPTLQGVTTDALVARLRPVTLSVDGRPLDGTVLDLSPWGHGWVAEARINDQFVIELNGEGVDPDGLTLVEVAAADIPLSPQY